MRPCLSQRSFAGRQNIDLSTRSLASWLLPFDGVVWRSIYRWNRVRGRELGVCSTRVWNPIRAVPCMISCANSANDDKLSIVRIVTSASVPGSRLDSDRLLLLQFPHPAPVLKCLLCIFAALVALAAAGLFSRSISIQRMSEQIPLV